MITVVATLQISVNKDSNAGVTFQRVVTWECRDHGAFGFLIVTVPRHEPSDHVVQPSCLRSWKSLRAYSRSKLTRSRQDTLLFQLSKCLLKSIPGVLIARPPKRSRFTHARDA